jgi:hypothetical protein
MQPDRVLWRHSNSRVGLWYNPHPQTEGRINSAAEEKHLKRIAIALLTTSFSSLYRVLAKHASRSTSKPKPTAQRAAAQRVSQVRTAGRDARGEQIKLLTKFIYLLGGVRAALPRLMKQRARNEASPAVLQKNQQSKATVKSSIQGFREGPG